SESGTSAIRVYPNPVTSELRVGVDFLNGSFYSITSADGRVAQSGTLIGTSPFIDCENLMNGLYHLRLQHETGVYVTPFVKQ
ncbi:MAG: Secretion system C-terminal sorting domain, partial [Bacteroidota bacterium]